MVAHKKKPTKAKRLPSMPDPDKSFKAWREGRLRFRVQMLEEDGTRTTWHESGPERDQRMKRVGQMKAIRTDLGLTQPEMAAALHIATKTFQGYEGGKPIPDPIFILAELIRDFPGVRKRLLAA